MTLRTYRDRRYEESHIRCGRCGKPKVLDIGPGDLGLPEVAEFCPGCSIVTPDTDWSTGLRAAVRAVVAAGRHDPPESTEGRCIA